MSDSRTERDSLGIREVPGGALYGIHAVRAAENFPFPGQSIDRAMIRACGEVKLACAWMNDELHAVSSAHGRHGPGSPDRATRFGS